LVWCSSVVQAIERVLAVLVDVEGARAERVVDAGRHAAFPFIGAGNLAGTIFFQIRLAGDHVLRWEPARPVLLPLDDTVARPFKTLAAKADAVAHGAAERLNDVKEVVAGID